MNSVQLIGRMTRDPELKSGQTTSVCRFSVAIDRAPNKEGETLTDYPNCVAFGKTAENIAKFFKKGAGIGITGRIQTGSYEKDGKKVYTTDVIVERFHFLPLTKAGTKEEKPETSGEPVPEGFAALDEDIPF